MIRWIAESAAPNTKALRALVKQPSNISNNNNPKIIKCRHRYKIFIVLYNVTVW